MKSIYISSTYEDLKDVARFMCGTDAIKSTVSRPSVTA
jgi:hypothetical protein